ncbi:gamma-glutamyl kinase [Shimia sp. SDUM112013]|uniref:gamma-glutamyl kinase n=1 Tax=Shimia sp. SDUM112013 TaxID=3136160 RepID=UPI0032EED1D0
MLVFWKEKLVFLSVPKTGTTAIEAALAPLASIVVSNPPELKHAPVYRYNRFFRPMFEKACNEENMETLAVMREPISWLGSWYRYRQRDFLVGTNRSTRGMNFDDFVDAYTRGDQPAFANVGSQAKFLEPRPNGTRVNHLFRYEDQPALIGFLEDRLATKIDLPRRNVSEQHPLDLSARTEAKLRRKCSAEFELYDSLS